MNLMKIGRVIDGFRAVEKMTERSQNNFVDDVRDIRKNTELSTR